MTSGVIIKVTAKAATPMIFQMSANMASGLNQPGGCLICCSFMLFVYVVLCGYDCGRQLLLCQLVLIIDAYSAYCATWYNFIVVWPVEFYGYGVLYEQRKR